MSQFKKFEAVDEAKGPGGGQISPDVNSKEWKSLKKRILKMTAEFKSIKEDLTQLYKAIDVENDLTNLTGKRQPKIINKLLHYNGDITPTMLISLVDDVEKHSGDATNI